MLLLLACAESYLYPDDPKWNPKAMDDVMQGRGVEPSDTYVPDSTTYYFNYERDSLYYPGYVSGFSNDEIDLTTVAFGESYASENWTDSSGETQRDWTYDSSITFYFNHVPTESACTVSMYRSTALFDSETKFDENTDWRFITKSTYMGPDADYYDCEEFLPVEDAIDNIGEVLFTPEE